MRELTFSEVEKVSGASVPALGVSFPDHPGEPRNIQGPPPLSNEWRMFLRGRIISRMRDADNILNSPFGSLGIWQ
ncbi:hypothetical protein MNBD_GAMMA16-2201 [hydrothermal vent metagenome]|uniref:Uncharacterized protein n=1 Tax=hydrothermal vent metagenome TaxID=652676 RepID=A0A3B1A4Z3_9ZZZZ